MKDIKRYFGNPYLWGTWTLLSLSLIIVGWAKTYPINLSPIDLPILNAISPLFWIGLFCGFLGIAGLSITSDSKYVHWISSCLFLLMLAAPQFLYISFGSDAGSQAEFENYILTSGNFDLKRDVAVHSYFQWPLSIFFYQFLTDTFNVDVYTSIKIGYLFILICISGGLFLLWAEFTTPNMSKAVFWGIVVYFATFYWVFNIQTVPYTFSLALLLPALALIDKGTIPYRILLLLLFGVGIESHPLFGLWGIIIVAILLVVISIIAIIEKKPLLKIDRKSITFNLLLLIAVVQVSLIIYKNFKFFNYLALSMQGYYEAMLLTGASDKSLAIHVGNALSPLPSDQIGTILKILSWVDLGLLLAAVVLATITVLINRSIKAREIALFIAGAIYFVVGTQYAAIGMRAIQLLALVAAFFVVYTISRGGYIGKVVLIFCVVGLMLFPAAIMRSHQSSPNYVKNTDILFRDLMDEINESSIENIMIISEHIRPLDLTRNYNLVTTRHVRNKYRQTCDESALLVDTALFRSEIQQTSNNIDMERIIFNTPTFYDNGYITLRFISNCDELGLLDE